MKEKELAMRSYKELADHEMDLWIKVNFSMTNNQGWRPNLLDYFNWAFWFSLLCPRPSFLFTKQFLWKVTKSHCIVKTMSQLNGYISLPSFSFSENVCWPWQKVQVNKENSTWNPQTDFFLFLIIFTNRIYEIFMYFQRLLEKWEKLREERAVLWWKGESRRRNCLVFLHSHPKSSLSNFCLVQGIFTKNNLNHWRIFSTR